jgi:hypothetical protein
LASTPSDDSKEENHMPTYSCPWEEKKEIRVPPTGEVVVEAVGAGYWEVERKAEFKGNDLAEEVLRQFDVWFRSIKCEGDCRKAGEECQKGFLWIGPPRVVKTDPEVVKNGRFTSTWRMTLYATGTLKIMCQCGKPRRPRGKVVVK